MAQFDPDLVAAASKMLVAIITAEPETRTVTRIEDKLQKLVREVAARTEAELLEARGKEAVQEFRAQGFTVQRRCRVPFEGIFGPMEIESPYLWNPKSKQGARPVQNQVGVAARGRSLKVQRALSDFGAEESFGQAAKRFEEHYGWPIDRTSTLRVVERIAKEAEGFVKRKLEEGRQQWDRPVAERPGAEQILVEADGCEIRTGLLKPVPELGKTEVRQQDRKIRETAWRDVRMGLARPLGEVEPTYVGKLDKYEEVVSDLFSAACIRGLSSNTQVIACTDGGIGIREEIESQFGEVRYVLDRAHAKKHLYETADAMELKDLKREGWVAHQLARLESGDVKLTLGELAAYHGPGEERCARLHAYLTRFQDAVHYEAFRRDGLPTGSGEIESSHRTIPQKRLKLPGTWWNEATINPMLALRILRANGWWNEFWEFKAAA